MTYFYFFVIKQRFTCKVKIVANGITKKLALIAICNKLLKQAFAIAKSGLIYDEIYRSIFVKKADKFHLFFIDESLFYNDLLCIVKKVK